MKISPRSLLLATVLLSAAPVAHGGHALTSPHDPDPAIGAPVALALVDDGGARLPTYPRHGRTWVLGHAGQRYRVRLSNRSDRRVLVVLSVDGVNAVSGQTAATSQGGYVLGPWQTAEIDGWRKSLQESARFYFSDLHDSYAARTRRPDNVGVVGIAVFAERSPVMALPPPVASRTAADAAETASAESAAPVAQQRIGTGHGERSWSPVSATAFVRASRHPVQVSELRYDDVAGLRAAGVLPRDPPRRSGAPRAFPGGFVPDPPAY